MKKPEVRRLVKVVDNAAIGFNHVLHNVVLSFFRTVNKAIKSKLPIFEMEKETAAHLHLAMRVFKTIVLPASLLYVFLDFYFFGRNALDSAMWGLLIFFYSNFLPDLPGVYWKKQTSKEEELRWPKKYALLLFAPLFVCFVFSGLNLDWKTAETFHNFKSLTVYGSFLLLLGFLLFGNFPMSIGRTTEILSISFYGVLGYLTHLKVDEIW